MLRLRALHLQHVQHARRDPVRGLRARAGVLPAEGTYRERVSAGGSTRVSADLTAFGLAVGHATDVGGATGLTIVRGVDRAFRCAAAVIGRATGTRELHAASPFHLVDRVDAVVLTGGSAYGLDSAAGAMRWMEERGRGHPGKRWRGAHHPSRGDLRSRAVRQLRGAADAGHGVRGVRHRHVAVTLRRAAWARARAHGGEGGRNRPGR